MHQVSLCWLGRMNVPVEKQAKNVSKWDIRSRVLPSTPFLVVEEGVKSFRQLKPIVCTRRGNDNVFLRHDYPIHPWSKPYFLLQSISDDSSPPLGTVWVNSDKYFGQIGWQIPCISIFRTNRSTDSMYINISDKSVDGFHVYSRSYIPASSPKLRSILRGTGQGSLQGNTNRIIYMVYVILHRPNISCCVCIYVCFV